MIRYACIDTLKLIRRALQSTLSNIWAYTHTQHTINAMGIKAFDQQINFSHSSHAKRICESIQYIYWAWGCGSCIDFSSFFSSILFRKKRAVSLWVQDKIWHRVCVRVFATIMNTNANFVMKIHSVSDESSIW